MIYTTLNNARQVVTAAARHLDEQQPRNQSLVDIFFKAQEAELQLKTQVEEERFIKTTSWTDYSASCIGKTLLKSTKGPSQEIVNTLIQNLREIPNDPRLDRSFEQGDFNFPIVHTEAKRLVCELQRVKWTPKELPDHANPISYIDKTGTNLVTENDETKTIHYSSGATTYLTNKKAKELALQNTTKTIKVGSTALQAIAKFPITTL